MVFLFIFLGFTAAQAQIGGSSSPVMINPAVPVTNEALAQGRYEIKKGKPTKGSLSRTTHAKNRAPASELVPPESKTAAPAIPAKNLIKQEEPEKENELDGASARARLPEDDLRKNQMEIQASPAFVYNGSTANYSYRNYSSFFPALDLSSNVWMTPTLGLHGRILFSACVTAIHARQNCAGAPGKVCLP